jgi:hypothetical protein
MLFCRPFVWSIVASNLVIAVQLDNRAESAAIVGGSKDKKRDIDTAAAQLGSDNIKIPTQYLQKLGYTVTHRNLEAFTTAGSDEGMRTNSSIHPAIFVTN